MSSATLQRLLHPLSKPKDQLNTLAEATDIQGFPTFDERIRQNGIPSLRPKALDILQINLGYMCNQTCTHCHVDAGPDRREIMTRTTMDAILDVLRREEIKTLDLTGGAPELNPDFRWFVEQARPLVKEIIVRSNLTIFSANKRFRDLPAFFAEHRIRVVSSLPCYTEANTDRQRGNGVFQRSIRALQELNAVGYGSNDDLILDLVYNPQGLGLPGPQEALEADYKRELLEQFDITFNRLFCITNLPISRFLAQLIVRGELEAYMHKLVEAFNPATIDGVMCRDTLSVGWDGRLFDCDFNQMLDLSTEGSSPKHISEFDRQALANRKIVTHQHCYGCTAGAGSSCQGTLV